MRHDCRALGRSSRFRATPAKRRRIQGMRPANTESTSGSPEPAVREFPCPPDLAEELSQAVADIEGGNYLELTPEQMEELGRTGTLDVLEA